MSAHTDQAPAGDARTAPQVRVDNGAGVIWFIGWMFTIAFAQLGWGKALLGVVIWPWFLGAALR